MADPIWTLEDRKDFKKAMGGLAVLCTVFGLAFFVYFIIQVSHSYHIPTEGEVLNLTHWGAFGDFIAGLVGTSFSLAGVFLLFLTLNDQQDNFHKERVESNFFEMIKFHRDNVNELQFRGYNDAEIEVQGRKVFKSIFEQFKAAWIDFEFLFQGVSIKHIYNDEYLLQLQSNKLLAKRRIDFKQLAQIDIIYLIVFFGVGQEDKQTISSLIDSKYNPKFVDYVLDVVSLKPIRESDYWPKWELIIAHPQKSELLELMLKKRATKDLETNGFLQVDDNKYYLLNNILYPDNYIKYYGGHQFRLGHYFRHLFQTVKFIDGQNKLSDDEKYEYIKILRGQLSNYEQIIFFANSLSSLGSSWELIKKKHPNEEIEPERHFITKYNLIKNIPSRVLFGKIDVKNYYPRIEYEAF